MEARAQPRLTTSEGLWRKTVKGVRGGTRRPGSMTTSIRDEGLLDYAEIEAIINVAPRALTSWQEAVASTSSPRVPLREWLALFDTIFDDAMRSPPTPDLYCCLSSKGLMNLSPVDQSPRTEL
jgi:hypothetical protein